MDLHDAVLQDVWTFSALGAQRYEDVGYEIVPPTMSARRIGTVTDEELATMVDGGIAYWLHGTAHHPDHDDVRARPPNSDAHLDERRARTRWT